MSTSDPLSAGGAGGAGDLARLADAAGIGGAPGAGSALPDVATLTRLANEMFGRLGGAGGFTAPGMSVPSVGVPGVTDAATVDAATHAAAEAAGAAVRSEMPGVTTGAGGVSPVVVPLITANAAPPASPAAAPAPPGLSMPSTVPAGAVPGGEWLTSPMSAAAPGFGFLAEVRSIDAAVQSAAAPAGGGSSAAGLPSETQLRSLAAMTPAATGVQAIPAASVNQSTAPGAGAVAAPGPAPAGLVAPTIGPTVPPGGAASGLDTIPVASAAAEAGRAPNLIPEFAFLADVRALENMAQQAGAGGHVSETHARAASAAMPGVPGVQAIPAFPGHSSVAGPVVGMASMPTGSAGLPALGSLNDPLAVLRGMGVPTTAPVEQPGGKSGVQAAALPFGLSLENLNSPQVLGAAAPLADLSGRTGSGAFDFAEYLRPLEQLGALPAMSVDPLTMEVPGMGGAGRPVGTAAPAAGGLGGLQAADISSVGFDVMSVRRDFPILREVVNGRPLVWLDNAATTQKPQAVIDRLAYFYAHENSNVHRAAHTLAARSTDAYELAREKVRRFLNASSVKEIVFVRGTTEAINLVAQSWGRRNVREGDEILITHLEHHANIVPWQMLCAEKGARLRVAPVDDDGQVILEEYEKLLNPRTCLVAFSHVSNALGTITPVRRMVEMAHRHGAKVLVDGAQSVAHTRVDVQEYDCDFFVFSGHKIFAPTGIGVAYGKSALLEEMPPWQGGGNMIADVTFERTTYNAPPVRFEAGTGNIADAVGLGAALDYIERLGMPNISRYEHDLLEYGTEVLRRIPGVRLIGTAKEKASVLSFVLDGYRTEDVGAALAKEGIAVRAGHHCAQPILRRFGVESTVRPSLAFYNTREELDALGAAIWNLKGGRTPGVV